MKKEPFLYINKKPVCIRMSAFWIKTFSLICEWICTLVALALVRDANDTDWSKYLIEMEDWNALDTYDSAEDRRCI